MAGRGRKDPSLPLQEAIYDWTLERLNWGREWWTPEVVARLPLPERLGFLVRLLHYQEGRSGFQFWIHNDYVDYNAVIRGTLAEVDVRHGDSICAILDEIDEIEARAKELEPLVEDVDEDDMEPPEDPKVLEAVLALNDLADRCYELDGRYWEIRREFLRAVEKKLKELIEVPAGITRALSVRQPYANLILSGRQKKEYRSQPTSIRERVWIYASATPAKDEQAWDKSGARPGGLRTGRILGSVEIRGCAWDEEAGMYAWRLAKPVCVPAPIVPLNRPGNVWWRPELKEKRKEAQAGGSIGSHLES
jgi:hypothetical protein